LAITNFVVLADSLAEAFPGIHSISFCEVKFVSDIRILQDSVNLSITSANISVRYGDWYWIRLWIGNGVRHDIVLFLSAIQ